MGKNGGRMGIGAGVTFRCLRAKQARFAGCGGAIFAALAEAEVSRSAQAAGQRLQNGRNARHLRRVGGNGRRSDRRDIL